MKEKAVSEKILRCINKILIMHLNRYFDEVFYVNILIKQYLSIISILCREGTTKVTFWG